MQVGMLTFDLGFGSNLVCGHCQVKIPLCDIAIIVVLIFPV